MIFREILSEDRVDFLKSKYEEALWKKYNEKERFKTLQTGNQVFHHLTNADPTQKKIYLQWIINMYLQPVHFPLEDCYKVREALELFDKNKARIPAQYRDINQLKNVYELYDLVEPFTQQEVISNNEAERRRRQAFFDNGEAELFYKSDTMTIIIPKTKEASCYFGKGTKWCTAASGHNYFDQYNAEGPLYIILPLKWQFHFESGSFMDERDQSLSDSKLKQHIGELLKVFEKQFKKIVLDEEYTEIENCLPKDLVLKWKKEEFWQSDLNDIINHYTENNNHPFLYSNYSVKYIKEAFNILGDKASHIDKTQFFDTSTSTRSSTLGINSNGYEQTLVTINHSFLRLAYSYSDIRKVFAEQLNEIFYRISLDIENLPPLVLHTVASNFNDMPEVAWMKEIPNYSIFKELQLKRIKAASKAGTELMSAITEHNLKHRPGESISYESMQAIEDFFHGILNQKRYFNFHL